MNGKISELAGARSALADDVNLKAFWPVTTAHGFHAAMSPDLGFSFSYDGVRVGPAIPDDWQVSTSASDDRIETTFAHPSGLTVVRIARLFPEFEAVEYTLRFRNDSVSVLGAVSDIKAVDVAFLGPIVRGVSTVSSGGGAGRPRDTYPPKDFEITRTYFGPMTPLDGALTLGAEGGNPSAKSLPMFFVENQAAQAGVFIGIGWTGQWSVTIEASLGSFTKHDADSLTLQGGMADIDVRLQPGEEISGPEILVGSYSGPLHVGSNRLRRLIRTHYAPMLGTAELGLAPMLYTTWFDVGLELDDQRFRILVDRAADLGQDVVMMDAGWYKGVPSAPFIDHATTWGIALGNWELGVELSRFPDGLLPLAEHVRAKGMRFGLWFEPERCGPDSYLATQHPEWIVSLSDAPWSMVNFGRPGVVDYFCDLLDRYIKELGIEYIRWDANMRLLPFWRAADPPDRRGVTEIRHIEGVHRVEDFLRQHHPAVILESCAGGGQHIELQSIQRRHTVFVSDQTMDPLLVRYHLEGLNLFLPGNMQIVNFVPPPRVYREPGELLPDIAYQSFFGGGMGLAGPLSEWPEAMQDRAREHFHAYTRVRPFLAEDYYALFPQARTLESWAGWQFHRPTSNQGFVQAFRIQSPESITRPKLYGLDRNVRYRFTDIYTNANFERSGDELISSGLPFDLPEMTSRVMLYEAISTTRLRDVG